MLTTAEQAKEVRRLRDDEGLTFEVIAERLGMNRTTCQLWYRELPRLRPWSVEDDARLLALAGSVPHTELAEQLGRTLKAVQVRLSVLRHGPAVKRPDTSVLMNFENRVLELRKKGLSVLDIAKEMNALSDSRFVKIRRICERPELRRYGKGDAVSVAVISVAGIQVEAV